MASWKAENAKAARCLGWATSEAEWTRATSVVWTLMVAAAVCRRDLRLRRTSRLFSSALVGLLLAAHPACICGALGALAYTLCAECLVAWFAWAEVLESHLFKASLRLCRAHPTIVLRSMAER